MRARWAVTVMLAAMVVACGKKAETATTVDPACRVMSLDHAAAEQRASTAAKGAAARAYAGRCVENNAYKMARSPDPAETVAKAAAGACETAAADAAQVDYDEGKRVYAGRALGFAEVRTDVDEELSKKALAAVVASRAARCTTVSES